MISHKLIANEISAVSLEDSGALVLSLMNEFKVSHLPVISKNTFLGIISEDDIINMKDDTEKISVISNNLSKDFIDVEKDVYEVIDKIHSNKPTLIPLLNDGKYLGSITIHSIISALASITAVKEGGGMIILALKKQNYQMSEIAQIIESNNAKILSSYITEHYDSDKLTVTLKLNIQNLNAIVQTFERYKYIITAHFEPTNQNTNNTISDRYDSLMRYLNP